MRAASLGLSTVHVEVAVESISDDRGILGLDDSVAAGPQSSSIGIRLSGEDAAEDDLKAIATWAVEHCPVVDAIRRSIPIEVSVEA